MIWEVTVHLMVIITVQQIHQPFPDVSDLTDTTLNLLDHFAVTIQYTAPTGSAGDLWWESDVGTLKIYYGGTWVDASPSGGGSGIALTDLSITTASAGTAALAYDNTTGVFTYTPPDLSGYQTTATAFDGDYNSLTNQPTIPSALANIADAGYGVDITGKAALTDGIDIDIGGSINAQATTLDFTSCTVNFSGSNINFGSTVRDEIDTHLTLAQQQILH